MVGVDYSWPKQSYGEKGQAFLRKCRNKIIYSGLFMVRVMRPYGAVVLYSNYL